MGREGHWGSLAIPALDDTSSHPCSASALGEEGSPDEPQLSSCVVANFWELRLIHLTGRPCFGRAAV